MSTRSAALRGCRLGGRLLTTLVWCSVLGCGGPKPQSFPVEGAVIWQNGMDAGELAGGAVEFEANGTVVATAQLQSDGTFTLSQPLPEGQYRVRVLPPADPSGPSVLDPRFQKFETSGLGVTGSSEPQFVPLRVRKRSS